MLLEREEDPFRLKPVSKVIESHDWARQCAFDHNLTREGDGRAFPTVMATGKIEGS